MDSVSCMAHRIGSYVDTLLKKVEHAHRYQNFIARRFTIMALSLVILIKEKQTQLH